MESCFHFVKCIRKNITTETCYVTKVCLHFANGSDKKNSTTETCFRHVTINV